VNTYLVLKRRHAWISQLDGNKLADLQAFCRDIESIRGRRQELKSAANA
jgi:hypothetical protein